MRRAIAMIELIFALVIMGIILMSAPLLISTANKSTYTGLQQETIAAGATFVLQLMSQPWDENNSDPALGMPVLSTQAWNCATAGVTAPSGRSCTATDGNRYAASPIGPDGSVLDPNGLDDIDDFDGNTTTINVYAGEVILPSQGDYIDQSITFATTIRYVSDAPLTPTAETMQVNTPFTFVSTATTRLKAIQVRITTRQTASEVSEKEILMSAFVADIGAPNQILSNVVR